MHARSRISTGQHPLSLAPCRTTASACPAMTCPARRLLGQPTSSQPRTVSTCSYSSSANSESSLAAGINKICNAAVQAMLAADEQQVPELERQLGSLRTQTLEARDVQGERLLRVVQGLLHHSVLKESEELGGAYTAALNRILNQVAGSEWKLAAEGQSPEAGHDEPRFSSWEEVRHKQWERKWGFQSSSTTSSPRDSAYYQLLGVAPDATQQDIKTAYRTLALQLHPDVSQEADAAKRFAAVATAYDVLSDPASRVLYDKYGAEGMRRHTGASAGSGNASKAWDEFKPHKRTNKRTQARDASAASYGSGSSSSMSEPGSSSGASTPAAGPVPADNREGQAEAGIQADQWAAQPSAGTVVEYPLPEVVRRELQDGRTHGVGLLVARNCDRGDAAQLPLGVLDLCEVEPLRQQEGGSDRWIPDELSCSAYVRLGELRAVPVDSFDQRFDVWVITAALSDGCGGPELSEEVML